MSIRRDYVNDEIMDKQLDEQTNGQLPDDHEDVAEFDEYLDSPEEVVYDEEEIKAFNSKYGINKRVKTKPELREQKVILSVRHLKHFFFLGKGPRKMKHKAVSNISFDVHEGECVGIVGESGCGKTTTGRAIIKLYDITSGSIRINGIDIRDYKVSDLRNNISFVFQDNYLFSGTIRDNILMGRPNATEEEIFNAVKLAHLDEFLGTLPDGIDTIVGERGASLSGGQRQRVAIARALIKNAPIVILDEATSALDNESEAIVQKALDNLMQNRTVFVIAHRLSTIHNADRIAVLNEGELVELGTHDELIKIESGKYRHLYEMQFNKVSV